ncbi:hypothetical protein B0H19DRAFT_1156253 [Mycena capillaripes]|nr:hypothetical protein B0H19DRAFT_1156253 [Mycena capillaripes]
MFRMFTCQILLPSAVRLCGHEKRSRRQYFFFAHSEWDRDFIAMFFRSDYRVLDKHYIFDCASNETRLPEQNYGYAGTYQRSCSVTTLDRKHSNAHRPHCTSR